MKRISIILALYWLMPGSTQAQLLSFNHLNAANGLSDNRVQAVTTDKNGFLWIGTGNGLNVFNGYNTTHFLMNQHPELCSNYIAGLMCDSHNRIWVGSYEGVSMIDEKRRFHKIVISDSVKRYSCAVMVETKNYGVILYTSAGHFYLDAKTNKWELLKWSTDAQQNVGWRDNVFFKGEQYIHTGINEVIILDYALKKQVFEIPVRYSISSCRISDDEIMVAAFKGKLYRVSISQHKILKEYVVSINNNGTQYNTSILFIRQAANGNIIIGTGNGGMYSFDPHTEIFSRYSHDPVNTGSLAGNSADRIFCDSSGNVFISTTGTGLNYFNVFRHKASNVSTFISSSNEMYDRYITCIRQDKRGRFWLGAQDCMVIWDPNTNQSSFYKYYYPILNLGERSLQIRSICFDNKERAWVGTSGGGLGLFNEATGSFTKFSIDTVYGRAPNFPDNFVNDILLMPDGKLWLCSNVTGIIVFDPLTFSYDSLCHQPGLGKMPATRSAEIFKDSRGNVWIGTDTLGAYCFDKTAGQLKNYKTGDGLCSNTVYGFEEDNEHNIYVATPGGLSIIGTNNKIITYNRTNGLKSDLCELLIKDAEGNIWISNNSIFVKFNPVKKSFEYYDEKDGLNGEGFKVNAGFLAADNTLYAGTERGLIYFSPATINTGTIPLQPLIYRADIDDSTIDFTGTESFSLSHGNAGVGFSFVAVSLYGEKNISYQYKLEGSDKDWINNFENRQVRYSSLAPGKYVFRIRASRDEINWAESANTITVIVHAAIWQTSWFKMLLLLLIAALVYYQFRQRISKIKERSRIKSEYEKKVTAMEMQALRSQMNPHFMFNSLNAINNFILKNDPENASGYLTKFSRLMRLILDNSRSEWVSLENELKALELYIELEDLRFDNAFTYTCSVSPEVDTASVLVPPMIIQPYVENAIWHGLLHRTEPGGSLDIHTWQNNGVLNIEIKDNGVGREKAKYLKSRSAIKHKSHGMQITAQRFDIVNKLYNANASVTATDLFNSDGTAAGTLVLISLDYKTKEPAQQAF